ncbi:hypothetical protein N7451_011870 [Penicillium sp. IBT 35674x]|nr:hypothetical protein N7451_011870 [Penicillium sp. IBT 35674x]
MRGSRFKDHLSNRLPSVQTLAASQLTSKHGSWWTDSLITGKHHHQFFVTSQYVSSNGRRDLYRAFVLNLDSLELHFIMLGDESYPSSDPFRLIVGVGVDGFEGISDDNLGTMRTHGTHEGVTFDLIYHHTTLSLVNGGPDITFYDDARSYGWGLPASSTYGTVTVREQTIQIDTHHSLNGMVDGGVVIVLTPLGPGSICTYPAGSSSVTGQTMATVVSQRSTWRQSVVERDPWLSPLCQ